MNRELINSILISFFAFSISTWRLGSLLSLIFLLIYNIPILIKSRFNIKSIYFLPLIVYHLFLIIFTGFEKVDFENYYRILILLIVFPIVFSSLEKKIILRGVQIFILGIFIQHLFIIFKIIQFYLENDFIPSLRSTSDVNKIINMERPYLGFMSSISVLFSSWFFKHTKRIIYLVFSILSVLCIFYISARLATILLLIYAIFLVFNYVKNKLVFFGLFISIALISLIIFNKNSTVNHRFIQIKEDSRVIIWKSATTIFFKDANYFFGSNKRKKVIDDLKNEFELNNNFDSDIVKKRYLKSNYNTHNQFLDELIIGGVFGLLLLLIPFFLLLQKSIQKKQIINFLIILSIILFLFVENVFERQTGVLLLSFLIVVVDKSLLNKVYLQNRIILFFSNKTYKTILFCSILGLFISYYFFVFDDKVKKNILESDFVINEQFNVGDVRRYGIFPNQTIGKHPKTDKKMMDVVLDLAESGIPIYFPKGFYKTHLTIEGRENIQIKFDTCVFNSIIQIKELGQKKSKNIVLDGELTSLVKFYVRNSKNVTVNTVKVKSDSIHSVNKMRSFGAVIHHKTNHIKINNLIVDDLGSFGKDYRYTRAAVEVNGLNNEPKNIFIDTIKIQSSDRSGIYLTGENIQIRSLQIEKFGQGTKEYLLPVEGSKTKEVSDFYGIWINKLYNSNIGKLDINLSKSKGLYIAKFDEGQHFRPVIIDSLISNSNSDFIIYKSKNTGVEVKKSIINE